MRDASALIATVDHVAGLATVTVRGELEPSTYSRLGDRLVWVAENCPRRLVLDLGVSDRFAEQLIDLIAATRRQLPVDCLLEVGSASPVVRKLVKLAGLPGVRVTAARQEAEHAGPGNYGQGPRVPDQSGDVPGSQAEAGRMRGLERASPAAAADRATDDHLG